MRILIPAIVLVLAPPAFAHHSYGDILRDQTVSIEGVVEAIEFVNPHVRLQVRTGDGTVYAIEWGNLTQLARARVSKETVSVGDRVIVRGSPHRDPAKRLLTLLSEIRRPADGWTWGRPGPGVARQPTP